MGIASAITNGIHLIAEIIEFWNAPDMRKAATAARKQGYRDLLTQHVTDSRKTRNLDEIRKDDAE